MSLFGKKASRSLKERCNRIPAHESANRTDRLARSRRIDAGSSTATAAPGRGRGG